MAKRVYFMVDAQQHTRDGDIVASEVETFKAFPKALAHASERSLFRKGKTFYISRCTFKEGASTWEREMALNETCATVAVVNVKRR
jgi:hypothetical protein